MNKDSLVVVNKILKSNFDFYKNKPSKFFTSRYCSHDSFENLYFVDKKILRTKHSHVCKNPEKVSSLVIKRYYPTVVYLRGNVYIFGDFDDRDDTIKKVEMYSHLTKTCKVIANIEDINTDEYRNYTACGFMDKIYLFGGYDDFERHLCIEFDTKDYSWKKISEMLERRERTTGCVFKEQIVVSGGVEGADDNYHDFYFEEDHETLSTVEAYDPIDDTWKEFPKMNYSRCLHKSVVVKNKLFVIAGGININIYR